MTSLIYLIGRYGAGKYTIAKEIAQEGYKIVDNHHINNPILSLLDTVETVPQYAWEAIRDVRKGVFEFIANERGGNFILTNELFDDNPRAWESYERLKDVALRRGSIFIPVKIIISYEENKRRISDPERSARYKAMVINDDNQQRDLIRLQHENLLELDISNLTAVEAAEKILQHAATLIENY